MKKKNISQPRVSPGQKIALVILGLILSLVLLEGGLRLGGFVILSIQEYRNLQSIQQKGAYRILCLGESTTQGQYPHLLERVLNERNIGVHFSVIDKGRPGVNTFFLLNRVEAYWAEYRPDMVVAMMGINDVGRHIPWEARSTSKKIPIFRSLSTYKLARLLWRHLLTKTKEMGSRNPAEDRRISEIAQTFSPEAGQDEAFLGPASAGDFFRRAIELDPKNDEAYVGLGTFYRDQGAFPEAQDSYLKAIALNPGNDKVYIELGRLYRTQDKFIEAEALFRKALELNPKNENAYDRLGWLYRDQGHFVQAKDAFSKAIPLSPNDNAYFGLGVLYRDQGKLSQAEDSFRKAIETDRKSARALGALASVYEEMRKPELAQAYAKRANELRAGDFSVITLSNYRKLKEVLDKKGVKLVCVQYPFRDVGQLKRIFDKEEGVIFVDNEGQFKEAVKKASYKEYFRDVFAGDFGHCTPKGNKLLAQNIAEVILREVFNK